MKEERERSAVTQSRTTEERSHACPPSAANNLALSLQLRGRDTDSDSANNSDRELDTPARAPFLTRISEA